MRAATAMRRIASRAETAALIAGTSGRKVSHGGWKRGVPAGVEDDGVMLQVELRVDDAVVDKEELIPGEILTLPAVLEAVADAHLPDTDLRGSNLEDPQEAEKEYEGDEAHLRRAVVETSIPRGEGKWVCLSRQMARFGVSFCPDIPVLPLDAPNALQRHSPTFCASYVAPSDRCVAFVPGRPPASAPEVGRLSL
ncbi:hypothetical protein QR680_002792 [Steinernema hermaphroditum]|uniref:Uncharacterized protein n=1 Tax=Steinernema hermaphroditum TaxID=289476 RepID=A0AA39H679_9BILA|nr:hypothetical protein QR680_002792 [Steinernema hermaphroditum]